MMYRVFQCLPQSYALFTQRPGLIALAHIMLFVGFRFN